MYRVSIELQKHEWKFGRTRNAVGTQATGKCFHSFFEFSQTSVSVPITQQKHREHVSYFFQQTTQQKRKNLVNFDYQNVNFFCWRPACVFSYGCFLNVTKTSLEKNKRDNGRKILATTPSYNLIFSYLNKSQQNLEVNSNKFQKMNQTIRLTAMMILNCFFFKSSIHLDKRS